jgi:hypothetical protein
MRPRSLERTKQRKTECKDCIITRQKPQMRFPWLITVLLSLILLCLIAYQSWAPVAEGFDPSLLDSSLNWIPVPDNGFIPKGYYQIPGIGMMTTIPNGYILINTDTSGNGDLVPYDVSMDSVSDTNDGGKGNTTYDAKSFDIQYHDSEDVIKQQEPIGTLVLQNGKPTIVPWTDISTNITYYPTGAYPYGASTYVPSYEDSVYLSHTKNGSDPSANILYRLLSASPFGANAFVSYV